MLYKTEAGFRNLLIFEKSIKTEVIRYTWDERMKQWLRRYEDIFGITKLSEMHENVLQAQARVHNIQQKRSKVQEEALTVQSKLREIQAKLEKISRGDDMFLSIVTEEHELIKQQKQLQSLLEVYDRTEREEHTGLALAINISQDHEKTYREKNKYLSLITGVIGGLIGVIGSSINNWRHKKDIKLFTSEISQLIKEQDMKTKIDLDENLCLSLSKLSENINVLLSPKNELIFENLKNQVNQFLTLVEAQDAALSNVTKDIKLFLTSGETTFMSEEQFYSDLFVKKIMKDVDIKLEKSFKPLVYVVCLSSILMLSAAFYIVSK